MTSWEIYEQIPNTLGSAPSRKEVDVESGLQATAFHLASDESEPIAAAARADFVD